jgi:hypothetical protein
MKQKMKQEDYVPAATQLIESLERDLVVINAQNHTFNGQYLQDFRSKVAIVEQMEQSDKALIEQKRTTALLYAKCDEVKRELTIFSMPFNKAGLESSLVSELSNDLESHNAEASLKKIKSLEQVIAQNSVVLISKGMKAIMPSFIIESYNEIKRLSDLQSQLIKDGRKLTEANIKHYNELYVYISETIDIGKRVFTEGVKKSDYTISKIIRILHVAKKK